MAPNKVTPRLCHFTPTEHLALSLWEEDIMLLMLHAFLNSCFHALLQASHETVWPRWKLWKGLIVHKRFKTSVFAGHRGMLKDISNGELLLGKSLCESGGWGGDYVRFLTIKNFTVPFHTGVCFSSSGSIRWFQPGTDTCNDLANIRWILLKLSRSAKNVLQRADLESHLTTFFFFTKKLSAAVCYIF